MFGGLGVMEVVVILLLLLLLFGAKRIPMIARGLGEGIKNFRSGVKDPDRVESGDPNEHEDGDGRRRG
jgi:sec-independent protein translocase protein TatA